jgi:hypothetical protein
VTLARPTTMPPSAACSPTALEFVIVFRELAAAPGRALFGARCSLPFERFSNDQIASRSAFAAACRRSLTSASSRAARSMRSCWVSVRSCWVSACFCCLSARSIRALSWWLPSPSTVRVRWATCPATVAKSCRSGTSTGFYVLQESSPISDDPSARARRGEGGGCARNALPQSNGERPHPRRIHRQRAYCPPCLDGAWPPQSPRVGLRTKARGEDAGAPILPAVFAL